RHTRFDCDWSSDVCSSDLLRLLTSAQRAASSRVRSRCGSDAPTNKLLHFRNLAAPEQLRSARHVSRDGWLRRIPKQQGKVVILRSEERRLGKECRHALWRE